MKGTFKATVEKAKGNTTTPISRGKLREIFDPNKSEEQMLNDFLEYVKTHPKTEEV